MAGERRYWVLCDDNCKFESMTKEQILGAIGQATGVLPEDIDVDDAFITKIKEMNAELPLKMWVGTTAEFQSLPETVTDCLYILTDDDSADSWDAIAEQLNQTEENITKIIDGRTAVEAVKAIDIEITNKEATITSTGIYLCEIKRESDAIYYSISLYIQSLSKSYKAVGAYNGTNYNDGVQYDATTGKITLTDATNFNFTSCKLIKTKGE